MTYNRVCNCSNTMDVTSGEGTDYPSRVPEFTPCFSGFCVARSLVFCAVFCKSLFVLFLFVIVLSVHLCTDSGIFKLYLHKMSYQMMNNIINAVFVKDLLHIPDFIIKYKFKWSPFIIKCKFKWCPFIIKYKFKWSPFIIKYKFKWSPFIIKYKFKWSPF